MFTCIDVAEVISVHPCYSYSKLLLFLQSMQLTVASLLRVLIIIIEPLLIEACLASCILTIFCHCIDFALWNWQKLSKSSVYGIQSIIYSTSAVATAIDTLYCTNVTELTNNNGSSLMKSVCTCILLSWCSKLL